MKKFISQIRSGCHHGKGSKYTRKGNFELALIHFQAALKYAMLSDDEAYVPLEMECVARTLVRLGNYKEAEEYAKQSLNSYKQQGSGRAFDEGVKRVAELIKIIEKRGSV